MRIDIKCPPDQYIWQNYCIDDCRHTSSHPYVGPNRTCALCPDDTLYTQYYSNYCVPVVNLYLVLGSTLLMLIGLLLCCAVFYRVRCGAAVKAARYCRLKMSTKHSSRDRIGIVNDGLSSEHEEDENEAERATRPNYAV